MTTLKEAALNYRGQKEITELDKVPADISISEGEFKNKAEQVIKYYFIELNQEKYKVKTAALVAIKELLTLRPQTKFFKVNKNTQGQYSAIPLD